MGFSRTGRAGDIIYRFHKATVGKFGQLEDDIADLPSRLQPGWAEAFHDWVKRLKQNDGKLIDPEQKLLFFEDDDAVRKWMDDKIEKDQEAE